jgi:hypothetical protein
MAPILAELKRELAGRLIVNFVDVWQHEGIGEAYGIKIIPTQIFYDAAGKELARHEGFISKANILEKWKELGVDLVGQPAKGIERERPLVTDTGPQDAICFMCDWNVGPKMRTLVKGQSEQRILCSPHCYFIYYSSLVNPDTKAEDAKANVTDWESGNALRAATAIYLYGMDDQGRPTIKAFAGKEAATNEQQNSPGLLLSWELLRTKELAIRCGFCDRAVYPDDAASVKIAHTHLHACCPMCALGVAARFNANIEMESRDALTGERVWIVTLDGSVAAVEPKTATAWVGQKKAPDGTMVSAGCFKQAFFVNEANLKTWLDKNPTVTGRQVTIEQALAAKMKLTPEQIAKACKLGECK